MSIERIETPHINKNDCWNLVLSKVTGKSYEEIRELFKDKMNENNALTLNHVNEFLISEGFTFTNMGEQPGDSLLTVGEVLNKFNNNIVILGSFDTRKRLYHLSYYEKDKHYTTSDTDECLNDPVVTMWNKASNEN